MKQLQTYVKANDECPFELWLDDLDPTVVGRIFARIDRVSLGNFGDHRNLGGGVTELRLQFGPGYRIYLTESDGEMVILLCGGDKSTQSEDIALAHEYLADLEVNGKIKPIKTG